MSRPATYVVEAARAVEAAEAVEAEAALRLCFACGAYIS